MAGMDYSAILFDLDGTLIDSLPGIENAVDQAVAALPGSKRARSLRPLIGPPIRGIFQQAVVPTPTPEQLDELERAFRSAYDGGAWRLTLLHSHALETLRTLQGAGIRLFVVTNKPKLPTARILAELGLVGYFEALVSRDSRHPPFSSKAEMLCATVSDRRLTPASCLYVGDTPEDLEAGTAAGLAVALVPHGYGAFDSHSLPSSCLPLQTLADLVEIVQKLEIS